MDEQRRDPNKTKKPKPDPITQAFSAYLQKKNYPVIVPKEITEDELRLTLTIDNEVSKVNSIMYSCINNDPIAIDQNFGKFLNWIKELKKRKTELDLELLIGPLFCHLYLDILEHDHKDRANLFFEKHYALIDKNKCFESVKDLLNAFTSDSLELSTLKNNFRSNKCFVNLSSTSVKLLKKFLIEHCHVVMFQVLQTCFQINEIDETEIASEHELITESNENITFMNGHVEDGNVKTAKQQLLDAISALKREVTPIYIASVGNVKDEVTSGLISRRNGIIAYSYNSGVHIRSILTLKQLDGMDDRTNEIIFREHSSKIYDFAIMPNEKFLFTASQDKTIKLFDLNHYCLRHTYKGHTYPVYCIAVSSDETYMASGSYDQSAMLWSTNNTEILRLFAGHTQEVTSINFHPNSLYLATGSTDKSVRMWVINNGDPVRLFLNSNGVVYSVSFSPCGRYLASAGEDKRLRLWDLSASKQFLEIKTVSELPTTKLAWSSDGRYLSAGSLDGVVKIWDFEEVRKNPSDPQLQNPISSVCVGTKLLSLEYCFDTFGCLTAQSAQSRLFTPEGVVQS